MMDLEIYFLDDSELAEFEATQKGYRLDVYVKIKNDFFAINVYDIVRLNQDYETEMELKNYYAMEPNLVLVSGASKDQIVFVINKLYLQKFFTYLKPVEVVKMDELKRIQ